MALVVLLGLAGCGQAAPERGSEITTVFLVRHAEKEQGGGGDPPLATAGKIRAKELARVLGDGAFAAVYVTNQKRSVQTGAPLAVVAGVASTRYAKYDASGLAKQVLAQHTGARVLVVGHSDTVASIGKAFGVTGVPPLSPAQYDRLFVIHICGGEVHLDVLRYGLKTP